MWEADIFSEVVSWCPLSKRPADLLTHNRQAVNGTEKYQVRVVIYISTLSFALGHVHYNKDHLDCWKTWKDFEKLKVPLSGTHLKQVIILLA